MTDTTPRAGAPLLAANQAQKNVTHNEALYQFDALICARFLDRNLTAPPSSPADGDIYLIKATATGTWTGQDGKIAYCADGGWRFYAPFAGLIAYVADETTLIAYNGSAWVNCGSLIALENMPMLGVNTTADSTNKLAVQSNAALFTDLPTGSGGSGDMRVTLSKQASSNTASFLFQNNFSGRAEVGLTGDDNFHFKVSPDGSTWHDGIVLAASSGQATINSASLTSATVTSADINGGTIDGTVIGSSATASGAFTTLSASGAASFAGFTSNAFKDGKTSAATTVQTDNLGRLLVGPTGSFSSALTVAGNVAGFQIAATNGSANLNTVRYTASAGGGAALSLAHSRAASIGSFATLTAGDQLGVINFVGDDGATLNTTGAQIRGAAIAGGAISTGIIPGQVVLSAMNTAGTLVDLCKIDATSGVTAATQVSTPKVSSNAASALDLQTSGGTQFEIAHTALSVNYLQAMGSASGTGTATLAAAGSDTNIDIVLSPKGTGAMRLATVANGAVATALSSVGPAGAHTTVQEWFAVKNASGVVRYIPAF